MVELALPSTTVVLEHKSSEDEDTVRACLTARARPFTREEDGNMTTSRHFGREVIVGVGHTVTDGPMLAVRLERLKNITD